MNTYGNTGQLQYMSESDIQQSQVEFLRKVYSWMVGGLALTGLIAYFVYASGLYLQLMPYMLFIALGTLGIVMFLSFRIEKMSSTTAMGSFIAYAALNGVFFSAVVAAYTASTLYNVFFITAGAFAALSFYGFVTKNDLSAIGKFLFMGVIGIVIALVLNMFIQSSALDTTISIIGVLVFAGLTAYDTQKLKEMHVHMLEDNELAKKGAIMGALTLYLDFINLFLFLLRLLGGGRD